MPLTQEEAKRTFDEVVSDITNQRPMDMEKKDLKDAAEAVRTWLLDPATRVSFNAALPLKFRTTATPKDKAFILSVVAARLAGR